MKKLIASILLTMIFSGYIVNAPINHRLAGKDRGSQGFENIDDNFGYDYWTA